MERLLRKRSKVPDPRAFAAGMPRSSPQGWVHGVRWSGYLGTPVLKLIALGSTYVLGHALSKVSEGCPQEEDVEAIFKKGWEAKQQWPKRLIVTGKSSAENIFKVIAEKHGMAIEKVSLSSLSTLVKPLKDSFSSSFNR